MPTGSSSSRLEAVQVLRAVAALLVVFTHAINVNDYRVDMPRSWLGSAGHFNEFGAAGVDLFFVISGFIMANTIMTRPQLGARQFLSMRFARVVPPFWLASLAFIPLAWLCGQSFTALQYAESATIFPLTTAEAYHMPVLSLGWTLAFELAFYGVVGAGMALAVPGRRLAMTMQVTCLFGLIGISVTPHWSITALLFNAIWFEFAAGLIVYWLWQSQPRVKRGYALSLLAISLAGLAYTAVYGAGFADHPRTLFWPDLALDATSRTGLARAFGWGLPSAGLLLASLWLVAGGPREALSRMPPWRGLIGLGDASYSLYLIHPFVLLPWQYLAPVNKLNPDVVILALVGLSAALALFVHRRIEAPLLRLLGQLIGRPAKVARPELLGTRPLA